MSVILGNANLTKIYTKPEFPLGSIAKDASGNLFRFIKYNDGDGAAGATVAGYLIVGLDTGGSYEYWEGTDDMNSATIPALTSRPFGFANAAITDGNYGWVQIEGPNVQSLLTDGGVAQGEELMAHATTTGGIDSHDDTAKPTVGVALEADTGTALSAGQVHISITV